MGSWFIGLCFLFGLLVFVAWISSDQCDHHLVGILRPSF